MPSTGVTVHGNGRAGHGPPLRRTTGHFRDMAEGQAPLRDERGKHSATVDRRAATIGPPPTTASPAWTQQNMEDFARSQKSLTHPRSLKKIKEEFQ